MTRSRCAPRVGIRLIAAIVAVAAVAAAAPALASWHQSSITKASIAYNQGVAFDPGRRQFFFDGVSSTTNSGLYRTTATLRQTVANPAVIPATREGYNHAGDLSLIR
jgi:hypothetical protein